MDTLPAGEAYTSTLIHLIELNVGVQKKMDDTSKNSNPRAKSLSGVHL